MRRLAGHVAVVIRNLAELLVRDAIRNWVRNRRTVTPALGSMTLLLLLAGLMSLAGLAVRNVVQAEAADAAVLRVYLRDGATPAQVDSLQARLRADPRVGGVRYVSKAEALRTLSSRPGMAGLVQQASGNPLPAGLEVTVRRLADVGAVAAAAARDPVVDPTIPTSYDAGVYARLQDLVRWALVAVSVLLAALALVAAAVTANAIRAGIVARADEVTTMRLVGAGAWMVRGPFVIEGALTGVTAGLVSAFAVAGLYAALQRFSAQSFTALLPGVGWSAAVACCLLLLAAGTGLGSAASLAGLRGLRR